MVVVSHTGCLQLWIPTQQTHKFWRLALRRSNDVQSSEVLRRRRIVLVRSRVCTIGPQPWAYTSRRDICAFTATEIRTSSCLARKKRGRSLVPKIHVWVVQEDRHKSHTVEKQQATNFRCKSTGYEYFDFSWGEKTYSIPQAKELASLRFLLLLRYGLCRRKRIRAIEKNKGESEVWTWTPGKGGTLEKEGWGEARTKI